MKPTNILLPEDLKRRAKIQAIQENISMAELVRRALVRYLAEREEAPKKE